MADDSLPELPEFAVVVRGYDREQVDTYIGELLALVHQLRGEVDASRAELHAAQLGGQDRDGTPKSAPVAPAPSVAASAASRSSDETVAELRQHWLQTLDALEGVANQLVRILATARDPQEVRPPEAPS